MKQFSRTQKILAYAGVVFMALILCMQNFASAQQITASLNSTSPSRHSFLQNADVFGGGFAQFTNDRTNHAHDSGQGASFSPGILFRFHKSYRWWLGYDVNYGYTRFTEHYFSVQEPRRGVYVSVPISSVQANANEFTAAYRIQGHSFFKVTPYAEGGIGETVFVPTGKYMNMPGFRPQPTLEVSTQHLLTGVYDVGLDAPHVISNHLGARLEYRSLIYNTPGFHEWRGNDVLMITQEAVGGMYVKF